MIKKLILACALLCMPTIGWASGHIEEAQRQRDEIMLRQAEAQARENAYRIEMQRQHEMQRRSLEADLARANQRFRVGSPLRNAP